jgi:hypothetical protein
MHRVAPGLSARGLPDGRLSSLARITPVPVVPGHADATGIPDDLSTNVVRAANPPYTSTINPSHASSIPHSAALTASTLCAP